MKVQKNDLPKSQVELIIELEYSELQPYMAKAAEEISKEIKIEGFRPGKAPLEIVKQKVGEMAIMEEAARTAIGKTIDGAIAENVKDRQPFGQPQVNITKLAPGNAMEYKVVLSLLPGITLGDYKDCKAKKTKIEITDVEIDKVVNELREMRVKEVLIDREVGETDKALLDIEMFLDKVPVEDGQTKGAPVIMGKNYIIPGFDKKIIGAKKGDTREFSLPFPAEHHQKNLAGKMVDFKVVINEVYERQLPELNDEFVSAFGLKTLDELKDNLRKTMTEEKQREADQKTEMEVIEKIIGKSEFGELPDALIENETEAIMSDIANDLARQGGKFEDYLASTNKSREDLAKELLPNAVKRVKAALVIREVAAKEKIEATDKEIDDKVNELLEQYKGYEKVEARVKAPSYRSYLYSLIVNKKVVEKLRELNIE